MDLRALIFMPALVGAVVFCFVFLLFACHYYLTVLESTGAGAKEVTWPHEPLLDNAWKIAYFGWLFGLWFIPAHFLGRAAAGGSAPWLTLAIPLFVLWVCYPISQLSSLSATSMWMPLVPDVFARLAQKPAVVLGFLGLSAITLAVFGLGFHWAFLTAGEWELLFVGAPIVVVAGLVYARLLGRLAFALRFTKGLFPTKKKKKRKADAEPEASREETPQVQPPDLPPVNTPDGELVGYNILMGDEPPPAPKKRVRAEVAEVEPPPLPPEPDHDPAPAPRPARRAPDNPTERARVWTDEDDEEATAYGMTEAEVIPAESTPEEVVQPRESEMALLNRDDAPKKPKRVWGPELFAFLGQPQTVSAILIASGLCFMVGVMIRVARAYNPVAGGE
jgi:hypothetical protein